ncbi:SRPBCC family protein [Phenylobacterium sp.]|uniref:SRPBCC family protein n=1 Tax=Phenylobacterium sp. TaxID=1871053 RepID=UPI0025E30310|nr:SRPBCC family protein [Phenylobacterium sp.]
MPPADPALGDVRRTGDTFEVVFHRRYARPIEKVWAALTVPERIADWFCEVEMEALRVGAPIRLYFREVDHRVAGQITACDPPRLFAWTWPQDGRPSEVRFELTPDGDGCRLTLTQGGLTPKDGAGVAAGWHAHLAGVERAADGIRMTWAEILEVEKGVNEIYRSRLPG